MTTRVGSKQYGRRCDVRCTRRKYSPIWNDGALYGYGYCLWLAFHFSNCTTSCSSSTYVPCLASSLLPPSFSPPFQTTPRRGTSRCHAINRPSAIRFLSPELQLQPEPAQQVYSTDLRVFFAPFRAIRRNATGVKSQPSNHEAATGKPSDAMRHYK